MQKMAAIPLLVAPISSAALDAGRFDELFHTPWRSRQEEIRRPHGTSARHRSRRTRARSPLVFFPVADVNSNPDNRL